MRIHYLKVRNFRGIRELDWVIETEVVCLIGHGDSTKSTVLEAVEAALSPRWDLPFTDADFFQGDTSAPICIEVTVGDIPSELLTDQKYGRDTRGWQEGKLYDEPQENGIELLSIRLEVNESLQPEWYVFNDRLPTKSIKNTDREKLGMIRLGTNPERHLSWGRYSALTRITGSAPELNTALASLNREARQIVAKAPLKTLVKATERAEAAAKKFGFKPKEGLRPSFDAQTTISNQGAFSLHDGEVPTRQYGLGSRRILALGLQAEVFKLGAVALIDEIEHGLEPHRIRHLLRSLKPQSGSTVKPVGQVFFTTHSPTVVVELKAIELYVVRSHDGKTIIRHVGVNLQDLVRKVPDALLARKIIVCEGSTEWGMSRSLDSYWSNLHDGMSLTYQGVIAVSGIGSSAPEVADNLAKLGYTVLLWRDSDDPNRIPVTEKSVTLVEWNDACCTEQRICLDLPLKELQSFVTAAITPEREASTVTDRLNQVFALKTIDITDVIGSLKQVGKTDSQIRSGLAQAAISKKAPWFKRPDYGEILGGVICACLKQIKKCDLAQKIAQIEQWVYAD